MIQAWKRMLAVSALLGMPSVQIRIDNAGKHKTNTNYSNIKGKASHKIVSDGSYSAQYMRTKFTNELLSQHETCCVT
jgi:hypothetical protein